MEIYKTCYKCGESLPATIEFFKKDPKRKDGMTSQCKKCVALRVKTNYQEKIRKDPNASYYIRHREQCLEQGKKHRIKNRERRIQQGKEYYQKNKEAVNARIKKYRNEHKEAVSLWAKKHYYNNPDKELMRKKRWLESRPGYARASGHKYRAKEKKTAHTLTHDQWEVVKKRFNNRCAYCGKDLPLAQDHFISLNNGGEYTHNNIIPACIHCNSSKGDRSFFEWYPKHKHYSKKRERLILSHLGYKNGIQQLVLF